MISETVTQYKRFNTVGDRLIVRLLPPTAADTNVAIHFQESVMQVFDYALRDNANSDMVGVLIRNEHNQHDKPVGISFRRKDQLSSDVIWSVLEKVSQSNSRFNATDALVFEVHAVKMPVGFGKALKMMGRQLSNIVHLKCSIVEVQAEKDSCPRADHCHCKSKLTLITKHIDKDVN